MLYKELTAQYSMIFCLSAQDFKSPFVCVSYTRRGIDISIDLGTLLERDGIIYNDMHRILCHNLWY